MNFKYKGFNIRLNDDAVWVEDLYKWTAEDSKGNFIADYEGGDFSSKAEWKRWVREQINNFKKNPKKFKTHWCTVPGSQCIIA